MEQEVNEQVIEKVIERAREKNIIIPTFEEMRNPEKLQKVLNKSSKT